MSQEVGPQTHIVGMEEGGRIGRKRHVGRKVSRQEVLYRGWENDFSNNWRERKKFPQGCITLRGNFVGEEILLDKYPRAHGLDAGPSRSEEKILIP